MFQLTNTPFYNYGQMHELQDGLFLALRGEHVLVHETKPERSHAYNDGDG